VNTHVNKQMCPVQLCQTELVSTFGQPNVLSRVGMKIGLCIASLTELDSGAEQ